jgi:predicted transcriptional regulator
MRYNNGMSKQPTSVRLSDTAKRLIAKLSAKLGISQSAVLEIAIREKAKKERVQDDGQS